MKERIMIIIILFMLVTLAIPAAVSAHGCLLTYSFVGTEVEVHCRYDDGQVLSEANVTVFSPDDPGTPWLQGKTDINGIFVFTPDRSRLGEWVVLVRHEGHGGIVRIAVEKNNLLEGAFSTLHLILAFSITAFIVSAIRFLRISRQAS